MKLKSPRDRGRWKNIRKNSDPNRLKINGRSRKNEKDRDQEIAGDLVLVIVNGPDHEKENVLGREGGRDREKRDDLGPENPDDQGLERREIERDRDPAKRRIEKNHHPVKRKNDRVLVKDTGIGPQMNLVIKGKGRDRGQGLKDRIDLDREVLLYLFLYIK